ncbi:hypothetical protein [Escherichia coli]|uniref:hypothetical protein n=1 Tax=Escherichia coli TaxID=562 RepID=UPI001577324C|nr:hypothetical protein [Escherichia coli]
MKNLAHIALVTVIQFIAVIWLIGGSAETVFILCFYCTMAGIVYMVIFSNTKKTACVG